MKRNHLWPLAILCGVALISLVLAGSTSLRGQNSESELLSSESPNTYVFLLELGSRVVAQYSECTGLGSRNDVEESIVETDDGRLLRQKTPGALEWPNIVLRGDSLSDNTVWAWRLYTLEAGDPDRAMRDGAIRVIDTSTLETVARWEFLSGWVASLTFGSEGEELVIIHDGLRRIDDQPGPSRR